MDLSSCASASENDEERTVSEAGPEAEWREDLDVPYNYIEPSAAVDEMQEATDAVSGTSQDKVMDLTTQHVKQQADSDVTVAMETVSAASPHSITPHYEMDIQDRKHPKVESPALEAVTPESLTDMSPPEPEKVVPAPQLMEDISEDENETVGEVGEGSLERKLVEIVFREQVMNEAGRSPSEVGGDTTLDPTLDSTLDSTLDTTADLDATPQTSILSPAQVQAFLKAQTAALQEVEGTAGDSLVVTDMQAQLVKALTAAVITICNTKLSFLNYVHVTGKLVFDLDNELSMLVNVNELVRPLPFDAINDDEAGSKSFLMNVRRKNKKTKQSKVNTSATPKRRRGRPRKNPIVIRPIIPEREQEDTEESDFEADNASLDYIPTENESDYEEKIKLPAKKKKVPTATLR